jgi:hypothetical protein
MAIARLHEEPGAYEVDAGDGKTYRFSGRADSPSPEGAEPRTIYEHKDGGWFDPDDMSRFVRVERFDNSWWHYAGDCPTAPVDREAALLEPSLDAVSGVQRGATDE